jgi:hypothetical protein
LPVARLPWARCRRGTAYRRRRNGRRLDGCCPRADRRALRKPSACLGSSSRSLVPKRDQALLIFRPNGELFDRQLFRLGFIRCVYQPDERSRRPVRRRISQVRSFFSLLTLRMPQILGYAGRFDQCPLWGKEKKQSLAREGPWRSFSGVLKIGADSAPGVGTRHDHSQRIQRICKAMSALGR